jgi:kynurenine formamidase
MSSTQDTLADMITAIASEEISVVDLSQTLGPDTPVISLPPEVGKNSPPLSIERISAFDNDGPAWYWNVLTLGEHTGTHFDAPNHWITGKDYADGGTDTIPSKRFIGPASVIDCSSETAADPDFLLTTDHILKWEEKHGKIPAGAWVLMRTDWSKRSDPQEFLNVDETGPHSPGPRLDAVEFLVKERDVLGFGVETVGTDAGQAGMFEPPFPCHTTMHGANKFGLASLTNLDALPPTGAVVIAAPLKIINGSGSPVRILALVPRH